MPRAATVRVLADIAEDQWGLFTRRQAEATGMAWTTLARMAKNSVVDRVAHGVYRLRGTPADEHLELRAAWLQLASGTPVWDRTVRQGVVCRWSAAAIYGLPGGPADLHQFNLPMRRQTRRGDVRLYRAVLAEGDWVRRGGLLVTCPGRIVSDLLQDGEDLALVAQLAAGALREAHELPEDLADALARRASAFGFAAGDGQALMDWLLHLAPPPRNLRPSPSLDSRQREAAAGGHQFLPLQANETRRGDDGRIVIRVTTVMRQGTPRQAGWRQPPLSN